MKEEELLAALKDALAEAYEEGYKMGWGHGNHFGKKKEREAIMKYLNTERRTPGPLVWAREIGAGKHHE